MTRPSLTSAIAWIAANDEDCSHDPCEIRTLISVQLVADLWVVSDDEVARRVVRVRELEEASDRCRRVSNRIDRLRALRDDPKSWPIVRDHASLQLNIEDRTMPGEAEADADWREQLWESIVARIRAVSDDKRNLTGREADLLISDISAYADKR